MRSSNSVCIKAALFLTNYFKELAYIYIYIYIMINAFNEGYVLGFEEKKPTPWFSYFQIADKYLNSFLTKPVKY